MSYNQSPHNGTSRVSTCGNYIYFPDGTRFKRTVLPSVAEPKKEDVDVEEALAETDLIRTQEID